MEDSVIVNELPHRKISVTMSRCDYRIFMATGCTKGVMFQIRVLATGNLSFDISHQEYLTIGDNLYDGRLSSEFSKEIQSIASSFVEDALAKSNDLGNEYGLWADMFIAILKDKFEERFTDELKIDLGSTLACIYSSEMLQHYLCRRFFSSCSWGDRWEEAIDIYVN